MLKQWPFKIHKAVLCAVLLIVSSCRDQIVHDLNEREANFLRTELNSAGLESSREQQPDGRWAVSVERSDAMPALQFLNSHRVLREESKSFSDKGSLISSKDDQRFRFERALSSEIESTLRSIDGVLDARVHLNLPVTDPLFGQPLDKGTLGSGSVLIVASTKLQVPESSIASLVAGASGVEQSKISVLINAPSQGQPLSQDKIETSSLSSSIDLNKMPAKAQAWTAVLGAKLSIANFGYLFLVGGAVLLLLSIPWMFKIGARSNSKREI
jgi:type III secretion protein J